MADATIAPKLDLKEGNINPLRPWKGITVSFDTSGTTSVEIDKRGYGLVGFKWDTAFTVSATCAVHVAEESGGTFTAHPDFTALDLTSAGVANSDVLSEWPYIKLVLNTAETSGAKKIEVVFS